MPIPAKGWMVCRNPLLAAERSLKRQELPEAPNGCARRAAELNEQIVVYGDHFLDCGEAAGHRASSLYSSRLRSRLAR